ncbi:MAG TPA: FAD-dependent oxidoreductase, partial [Planctomycetaceae bacterium]|nr:FAD-dependent oxidoreductase [Planctomycetaceae bacterium]
MSHLLFTFAFAFLFLIAGSPLSLANQIESDLECDLLVVGGTESGWAAAIQAARMGVKRIVLVNDIDWLGGQYTAEAVCALDENRGINRKVPFHRSGLFAELTGRFEQFNLEKYGHPQPGNAWTARTTVRPAEAEAIFRAMLQPYLDLGQVRLYTRFVPERAVMGADKSTLEGLEFRSKDDSSRLLTVRSTLTIDASDWGDAIKLAGAEYEFGVDPRHKYDEPNAPTESDLKLYPRTDMNPITWCMVIEETEEEQVIEQPQHYDDRNYFLTTNTTEEDYRNLGWPHKPHRPFNPPWMPSTGTFYSGDRTVYSQRRLIDSYGLDLKGDFRDVILLNWSVQDYPLDVLPKWVNTELEKNEAGASRKNIVEMTPEQRQIIFEDAKRQSLGMLYHLQTTVHDRLTGEQQPHSFRRFRLSREFGTPDHLPPKPYIRESLRLKAMYMMREQDTRNFNRKDQYAAAMYYDGIAAWQFPYDFHPTGRAFLDSPSKENPWEISIKPRRTWNTDSDRAMFPLRSLIPFRVHGLLGAQKNLGYSSIVSSAVRLHDQCVHIG